MPRPPHHVATEGRLRSSPRERHRLAKMAAQHASIQSLPRALATATLPTALPVPVRPSRHGILPELERITAYIVLSQNHIDRLQPGESPGRPGCRARSGLLLPASPRIARQVGMLEVRLIARWG